jgi:hypothetical protein
MNYPLVLIIFAWLGFNCDKYDELRKTLFHKIKSLRCPNVNLNSFKNEINTYLVELFLQGRPEGYKVGLLNIHMIQDKTIQQTISHSFTHNS